MPALAEDDEDDELDEADDVEEAPVEGLIPSIRRFDVRCRSMKRMDSFR